MTPPPICRVPFRTAEGVWIRRRTRVRPPFRGVSSNVRLRTIPPESAGELFQPSQAPVHRGLTGPGIGAGGELAE